MLSMFTPINPYFLSVPAEILSAQTKVRLKVVAEGYIWGAPEKGYIKDGIKG